ncbi:hypothetical protein CVT25_008938 [Psilocybe cyanescens]|uniref:Uncharacterized protein n=1 Tax=Psilocybe cyanescens TaxID=93625 RepID=A0A409XNF9_PSICY|nr:hypothetical protein CVT25_008938 [Psilocybe cyanescens]
MSIFSLTLFETIPLEIIEFVIDESEEDRANALKDVTRLSAHLSEAHLSLY